MKTKISISVLSMFIISSSLAMQMQAGMQGSVNNNMGNGRQEDGDVYASGTPVSVRYSGQKFDHPMMMQGSVNANMGNGMQGNMNGMQGEMMKPRKDFDCMHTFDGNMNGHMMMATATMSTSTMNMNTAPEAMASGSMMYMPALKLGDGKRNGKQEMVRMLQVRLISDGLLASNNATGYFGNATHSAVKKFQVQQGIQVSGLVATTTTMKMREPCEGPGRNMKDGMRDHGMKQSPDSMRSSGTMPMMKNDVMMKNDTMIRGTVGY